MANNERSVIFVLNKRKKDAINSNSTRSKSYGATRKRGKISRIVFTVEAWVPVAIGSGNACIRHCDAIELKWPKDQGLWWGPHLDRKFSSKEIEDNARAGRKFASGRPFPRRKARCERGFRRNVNAPINVSVRKKTGRLKKHNKLSQNGT